MLTVHTETIGATAVVDCEGRLIGSEASCQLYEAVASQIAAFTVVLDFTSLYEIDDAGLASLLTLQKWAAKNGVQLKFFNPISAVRNRLQHREPLKSALATYTEIVRLAQSDTEHLHQYAQAA